MTIVSYDKRKRREGEIQKQNLHFRAFFNIRLKMQLFYFTYIRVTLYIYSIDIKFIFHIIFYLFYIFIVFYICLELKTV